MRHFCSDASFNFHTSIIPQSAFSFIFLFLLFPGEFSSKIPLWINPRLFFCNCCWVKKGVKANVCIWWELTRVSVINTEKRFLIRIVWMGIKSEQENVEIKFLIERPSLTPKLKTEELLMRFTLNIIFTQITIRFLLKIRWKHLKFISCVKNPFLAYERKSSQRLRFFFVQALHAIIHKIVSFYMQFIERAKNFFAGIKALYAFESSLCSCSMYLNIYDHIFI